MQNTNMETIRIKDKKNVVHIVIITGTEKDSNL